MPLYRRAPTVIATLLFLTAAQAAPPQEPTPLHIRPQVVSYRPQGFVITGQTRILLPKDWPPYVAAAAAEVVRELKAALDVEPVNVPQERLSPQRGDIVIGPYWAVRPEWEEPLPPGLVRPPPEEGYNLLIDERSCAVLGNSPRASFLGLQTLIQVARQCRRSADEAQIRLRRFGRRRQQPAPKAWCKGP